MPSTTFFGCEISMNKPYTFESFGGTYGLYVSQAAIFSHLEATPTRLFIETNGERYILCTLTPGICDQCVVKADVPGEAVFSVIGTSTIHLTGFVQQNEDESEEEDPWGNINEYPITDSDSDASLGDDDESLVDSEVTSENEELLVKDIKISKNKKATNNATNLCTVCNRTFITERALEQHNEMKHQ